MISFFGQKEFYLKYKNEYHEIIDDVLSNDELLRGHAVRVFEEKIAAFVHRKYAIAVKSGTDALLVALMCLGISEGDEVIVPAFSFVASAEPVKLLKATPVFVDINNKGFIDVEKIEEKISHRTKAIIAVDIFGETMDYRELTQICSKHNLALIEDAAQGCGSSYNGFMSGSFGDISAMSFDVSKTVYGISTGGVVLTDNIGYYTRASKLRGHGFNPDTREFEEIGLNSNMSSVNAALLSFRLDLEEECKVSRDSVRDRYDMELGRLPGISLLERDPFSIGNNHKYVIFSDRRDELKKYLISKDIPVKIHYDKPIPYYKAFGCCSAYPVAKSFSERALSLPIHPLLLVDDQCYIIKCIKDFFDE